MSAQDGATVSLRDDAASKLQDCINHALSIMNFYGDKTKHSEGCWEGECEKLHWRLDHYESLRTKLMGARDDLHRYYGDKLLRRGREILETDIEDIMMHEDDITNEHDLRVGAQKGYEYICRLEDCFDIDAFHGNAG